MASHSSSPAKVFNIPELVNLVSTFSRRSDQVRLSQVSRRIFDILIPVIWRSVEGADILLGLIKSVSFQYHKTDRRRRKEVIIEIQPNPTDPDPFERFDIYAPHVQTLSVHRQYQYEYTVLGWPVLIARAQNCPLLPNLRALHILSGDSDRPTRIPDVNHEIMWIATFASGSTVEMHTSRHAFWIQFSTTSIFLEALMDHCPNVERLTLRSADNYLIPSDTASEKQHISSKPWYEHLGFFQHLRYLSISEGWLYPPCLLALGQLPRLESLQIDSGELEGYQITGDPSFPPSIPPGAFPVLSQLLLQYLRPYVDKGILKTRGMLQQITHLYLAVSRKHIDPKESGSSWLTQEFFPLLANTPMLETLEIFCYGGGPAVCAEAVPAVLDVMSQLPLEIVHLNNFYPVDDILGIDLDMVWPNVKSLSMAKCVSLQELAHIISMPKLERLSIEFDLLKEHVPENIVVSDLTRKRILQLHRPRTAGLRTRPDLFDLIDHNARVLSSLWPNLCLDPASDCYITISMTASLTAPGHFNHLLGLHTRLEKAEREQDLGELEKICRERESIRDTVLQIVARNEKKAREMDSLAVPDSPPRS